MENLASMAVGQILEKAAAQVPDKIAVVDGKQRKTYGELNLLADALAARLTHAGLQKGDCVAIYMKNSLELVIAFYALGKSVLSPNRGQIHFEKLRRQRGFYFC